MERRYLYFLLLILFYQGAGVQVVTIADLQLRGKTIGDVDRSVTGESTCTGATLTIQNNNSTNDAKEMSGLSKWQLASKY